MEKSIRKLTPKTRKNKSPRNPLIYNKFIEWISLADILKSPSTQGEFAEKFGVSQDTLTDWKKRDGFWDAVKSNKIIWARERTPDVVLGLYKKAKFEGGAAEVKLWLQVFEGFSEKTESRVNFTQIQQLSEEIKKIAEN